MYSTALIAISAASRHIGQKVGIFVNGVMYYRETDDLGVASLKINLNPGHYMITSGLLSNAYEAKTMNNIITVSGGYLWGLINVYY